MELRESIESINEKLIAEYGREFDGRPRLQVVFSDDQFEKRLTDYTDEGFKLLQPEVRLLPKYRQYIRGKYLLERLVPVPEGVETDLVEKMTYECIWVFHDKNGKYLPPFFDGCKFVVESIHQAIGRKNTFTRYKDKNISPEEREAELLKVQDQLFGNESDVTDHLSMGSGVTVDLESQSKLVH